jgi:hypothetical protein
MIASDFDPAIFSVEVEGPHQPSIKIGDIVPAH